MTFDDSRKWSKMVVLVIGVKCGPTSAHFCTMAFKWLGGGFHIMSQHFAFHVSFHTVCTILRLVTLQFNKNSCKWAVKGLGCADMKHGVSWKPVSLLIPPWIITGGISVVQWRLVRPCSSLYVIWGRAAVVCPFPRLPSRLLYFSVSPVQSFYSPASCVGHIQE